MVKKFVKPLLLSGLGLIGLTAVLWGLGQIVAQKSQVQMDVMAAEFLRQFPKTTLNDSARELERRMVVLGLTPSSNQSDVAPREEAQRELQAIEEELTAYLDQQVQKTGGLLDPVPAPLKQYVQTHRAELLAVQEHLITAEQPTWELNAEAMADFSYAHPGFIHLTQLNRLLLLQAITDQEQGNIAEMRLAIEASTQISSSLFQRPDLLSNLVGLILNHQQAGVLRHLEAVPAMIPERLMSFDQQRSMVRSLNFENWMTYGGMKKTLQDSSSWKERVGDDDLFGLPLPLPKLYFALSNVDTTQALEQTYRKLPERSICEGDLTKLDEELMVQPALWNQLGKIAMPGFLNQWQKGGMRMLELELTQKVLEAKALAVENRGQWPGSLPNLSSAVCPGEAWVYEVSPEGAMSLSFSHNFEGLQENERFKSLPLVYQSPRL